MEVRGRAVGRLSFKKQTTALWNRLLNHIIINYWVSFGIHLMWNWMLIESGIWFLGRDEWFSWIASIHECPVFPLCFFLPLLSLLSTLTPFLHPSQPPSLFPFNHSICGFIPVQEWSTLENLEVSSCMCACMCVWVCVCLCVHTHIEPFN